MFRELDLFRSSGEVGDSYSVGFLRGNVRHWTNHVSGVTNKNKLDQALSKGGNKKMYNKICDEA
jgi:hypothetical protein